MSAPTTVRRHEVEGGYDPLDEAFLEQPYAAYAWLRDHDPVHRHTDARLPEFFVLSRFEDVWAAVRDPAAYSSAQGLTWHPDEIGTLGLAPTIVMLDPPRQTRLRALIGRAFTPRRIASMEDQVRAFVQDRLAVMAERAAAGEAVDAHRDLAAPLPTYVLAELLGVPESDRDRFGPWVRALTELQDAGFSPEALSGPEAVADMFGYFSDVIAQRRQTPTDDLIGALVAAEIDGEQLTDWDILGFCFVMVAGGNDTTASLVSHGLALLTRHPAERERLLADRSLIPTAVMEFLRLEGSVQGLARTTTREVTVHGVEIPEGTKVLLSYAAANRDEREFGPTVDELDVGRDPSRHLGFGSGPHFCVGNHAAKLMARVAFEEILEHQPGLVVDEAAGQRLRSAFTRGWVSLPAHGLR